MMTYDYAVDRGFWDSLQGNQNGEVAIYAYVSERSFFVYGWQTVERKAAFVGQVMRATPDGPRPRARSS